MSGAVVRPLISRLQSVLPWGLAVLSGGLMAGAFAPLNEAQLAWCALVPLLIAVARAPAERRFALGFTSGAVFWLFSLFWLTRVTVAGWIGLSLYCAAYAGIFGWIIGARMATTDVLRFLPNLGTMAWASLAWVGLEFIRCRFATGFPWNPLGLTQYENLPLIQYAAWGGVYLLSALIVWVNVAFALTILRYVRMRGRWGRRPHLEVFAGVFLLVLAFAAGWRAAGRTPRGDVLLRAAVIQPDIPQDEKWDEAKIDLIYRRLRELSDSAIATQPDLLIWPETALPDDVRYSPSSYRIVSMIVTQGVPLLAGSMDSEWPEGGAGGIYYNSSFLFDVDGAIVGEYRKQHLVPFGEYVPFRRVLPFMKAMTPIQESFDGGTTGTVLQLERPRVDFGVLICFEDAVPSLARETVRNGARLIINQTNDAWFDPWWAQWQHMAHSVFRAVENGVPVIRAANSGVSCFIDRRGRVLDVLEEGGRVRFPGFRTSAVEVPMEPFAPTFYTRHGDVFAWSGVWVLVLGVVQTWRARRSTMEGKTSSSSS